MFKRESGLIVLGGVLLAGVAVAKWPAGAQPFAKATLSAKSGSNVIGTVDFAKSKDGLIVRLYADRVPKGSHGFHIHEKGDCSSADAKSAGDHYNPGGHKHGGPSTGERHIGDLGNVVADDKEAVRADISVAAIDAKTDWNTLVGKSIVLHEKADDLKTQPSGDSGKRIACGVIEGVTLH